MEKIYRQPLPQDTDALAFAQDIVEAGMVARSGANENLTVLGRFHVECVRDDEVIWTEDFDNVVTDDGKKALLDKVLGLAAAFSGCHMGLKGNEAAALATHTMVSHGAWTQLNINATRQSITFAAASGAGTVVKNNNASPASFAITSGTNTVVGGVYVVLGGTTTNTDTTGTLFSAGDFASTKTVSTGDTLNVTYQAQLT